MKFVWVSTLLLSIGLVFAISPAAQATTSLTMSGSVACAGGQPVEGVWVQSSGGGSKFAGWRATSSTAASYSATISTAVPTVISLHVGCGGSASSWNSDNRTPPTYGISGNYQLNVTSCNSPPRTCTWATANAAAAWAQNQFTGNCAQTTYKLACLAFVYDAYHKSGLRVVPNPTVYGGNATALDEYYCYSGQPSKITDESLGVSSCPSTSLIHTGWQHLNSSGQVVTDKNPPRGAFVFFPNDKGGIVNGVQEGHIAISIGGGYVISAGDSKDSTGCYLHKLLYNSSSFVTTSGSSAYVGWAFPKNAYAY